jgi:hypothetical protein
MAATAGLVWLLATASVAQAEPLRPLPPPPAPSDAIVGRDFNERFVLDTGRITPGEAPPGEWRIELNGEYQLRATALTDLPLPAYRNDPGTTSLGQTLRVEHWLRLTPRFSYGKNLRVVAQMDVPRGFIAGQTTRFVDPALDDYAERSPFRVAPRWLYAEILTPIGLFRVGQQPSHWGMGILANDGDHPRLFGDYTRGSIAERLLFATRPLGESSGWTVALAGDLVFQDPLARLVDGDRAWQGVFANTYETRGGDRIGLYGVYRYQTREAAGGTSVPFDETLKVFGVDSAGRMDAKLPGEAGHAFGEYEVAYLFGSTNFTRTLSQAATGARESVSQLGAAARLGVVFTRGSGAARWGYVVPTLEWGYASGDADPNDGTTRRFRFDASYRVGLLMFSEALAWRTARAAAIARDPELVARPAPGSDLLPSNGGIFGATYLNPTLVVRPLPTLDLKVGAVIAQATSDVVDPVRLATTGRFANYDGGDARRRDLGVELDLGVEQRIPEPKAACSSRAAPSRTRAGLRYQRKRSASRGRASCSECRRRRSAGPSPSSLDWARPHR